MDHHPEQPYSLAESTATTLIEQLKAGDEDSWDYFLFAYRPLIVKWALQKGASKSDAADVAQEVVTNVVRGMEGYKKGEHSGSFRKWLKTITHRRTVDHLRKHKKQVKADGGTANLDQIHQVADSMAHDPETVEADEQTLVIQRTLACLRSKVKPHTFDAFYRVVVDGQDPKQVAADLQISLDVVYQATSRMLGRMRQVLCDEMQSF